MSNHDQQENLTKIVIFGTLYVTGPILLLIDVWAVYLFISGQENLGTYNTKMKIGLFLMFIVFPAFIYYCYWFAKQKYGLFGKKSKIIFDDDLSKQICKIGGPIVLFVCCPLVIWLSYYVFKKAIDAGEVVKSREIIEIAIVNLFALGIGLISTYKGYEEKFRK